MVNNGEDMAINKAKASNNTAQVQDNVASIKKPRKTLADLVRKVQGNLTEKSNLQCISNEDLLRQIRKDAYNKNMAEYFEYIKTRTFVGQVLVENGYDIFDVNQAEHDFRKIMGLDKITEIAGVYYSNQIDSDGAKETKQNIISIGKGNFWQAFYSPIWKNLTPAEKIKSLEWMMESINQQYDLNLKPMQYIPEFGDDSSLIGFYSIDKNRIYINLNFVLSMESAYEGIVAIGHETTHARQHKNIPYLKDGQKTDVYTLALSQQIFNKSNFSVKGASEEDNYALYRISPLEKVAELQGIKYMRKYKRLNEQVFGKNTDVDFEVKLVEQRTLFGIAKARIVNGKEKYGKMFGILANENFVLKGVDKAVIKLLLLQKQTINKRTEAKNELSKCFNDISVCKKNFANGKISRQQCVKQCAQYQKQADILRQQIFDLEFDLSYYIDVAKKTLQTGSLPEKFDTHRFDCLNIDDSKNSKYSFPKWLRKEEDDYKKYVKRQNIRFEKMKKIYLDRQKQNADAEKDSQQNDAKQEKSL